MNKERLSAESQMKPFLLSRLCR